MLAVVLSPSDAGGADPNAILIVVNAGVPPPHAVNTLTAEMLTNKPMNLDLNTTRYSHVLARAGCATPFMGEDSLLY
jgi:hypothetical protein